MNPSFFPPEMLGFLGEQFAASYFKSLGYSVSKPDFYHYGDLCIDQSTFIEVKTIRLGQDGSYSATIRKTKSQSIGYSDFILLYVCAENIYPYIIPAAFVPTIKRIHISSHPTIYAGKYLQFLHNWQPLLDHIKKQAKIA